MEHTEERKILDLYIWKQPTGNERANTDGGNSHKLFQLFNLDTIVIISIFNNRVK